MNPPSPVQSSAAIETPPSSVEAVQNYVLTSDLAQYCLPFASQDVNRKFAWANSICFFVLLIGIIGVKEPQPIPSSSTEVIDVVPIVFTPPEEQPKVEPEVLPDEPEPQPETAMETPVVATVVAPESSAAFPVPVEGPVILAPSARYASAPPPVPPKPAPPSRPKPTVFDPNAGDGGSYPPLTQYPPLAEKRGQQGNVTLYVIVDRSGAITSVEVKESSGSNVLDSAALQWVKSRYKFPAGETRHYLVSYHFELPKRP